MGGLEVPPIPPDRSAAPRPAPRALTFATVLPFHALRARAAIRPLAAVLPITTLLPLATVRRRLSATRYLRLRSQGRWLTLRARRSRLRATLLAFHARWRRRDGLPLWRRCLRWARRGVLWGWRRLLLRGRGRRGAERRARRALGPGGAPGC